MGLGLGAYRAFTTLLDPLADTLGRFGRSDGVWREGFRWGGPEAERAAGSVWIHAASMGEVGAARPWVEALAAGGYRPPFLFTTRTRTGLSRARGELGDRVSARLAPHDLPRLLGRFLETACPWRLDVIETELWPNLILEARARSIPVLLVSATVSERSTALLQTLGVAGAALLGSDVYALPQTERHAARFASLGVPRDRIRVVGDLKADAVPASRGMPIPFAARPALVFGSLRPGEEHVARALAESLESHRAGWGREREAWASESRIQDPFEGRNRGLLVIAPRHAEGERRTRAAFRGSGFEIVTRDETSRAPAGVTAWIEETSRMEGRRVALLATRGELAAAYGCAWGAVIGGTFAPFGGHNVWEAAAAGAPVLVGPHHGEVSTAVEAVLREGGGVIATDTGRHLATIVRGWLEDEDLEQRGVSAARAVSGAAGTARRALDAVRDWGLVP